MCNIKTKYTVQHPNYTGCSRKTCTLGVTVPKCKGNRDVSVIAETFSRWAKALPTKKGTASFPVGELHTLSILITTQTLLVTYMSGCLWTSAGHPQSSVMMIEKADSSPKNLVYVLLRPCSPYLTQADGYYMSDSFLMYFIALTEAVQKAQNQGQDAWKALLERRHIIGLELRSEGLYVALLVFTSVFEFLGKNRCSL